MSIFGWIKKQFSFKDTALYYRLSLAFLFLFILPSVGFLFIAAKYEILGDQTLKIFFLIVFALSLFGFVLLRTIVDEISNIARSFSNSLKESIADEYNLDGATADELRGIVSSFDTINMLFKKNLLSLNQEASKITALKELANLCYVTFDMDELFLSTLQRALKMVQASSGSILILEKPNEENFIVQASIGREDRVRKGSRIPFVTSIAKYAVINKTSLLVENIDNDNRFGTHTRFHYNTKSFICMPLKTINEIVGVLAVTNKVGDGVFTQEDVDALTPLLSTAALSYNNLSLLKKSDRLSKLRKSFDKVARTINSSLHGDELLHAILREINEIVPFKVAIILFVSKAKENELTVFDALTFVPTTITKGSVHQYNGSIIDRAIREEKPLIFPDTVNFLHPVEQELIKNQGIRSLIVYPLRFSGRVTGAVLLGSDERNRYSYREGELVYCLVEQYSNALEKDRLSIFVDQRKREMDTLNQIGNFLAASTFDIDRVLRYTMDMIGMLMRVEAGSLLLLEGEELVFKVALKSDIDVLKTFRLKLGQGIIGYAAARGEPVIVGDVANSPHFFSDIDHQTGFVTKSVLCVPMISQGKVIGAIEVLNKINGEFDDNDVHLLQSTAASVTIALENARLYKETVEMAEQERSIRMMFQKFVPKEVVEKIIDVEQAEQMRVGELKTLTFLNIDIRGFSKLSQSIGPQKAVGMLNYFFSIMGNIVLKHKGIVDKYLGDGFLAIFGAGKTSVADADNAIAAALEMKEAMHDLNEHLERQVGVSFAIGISINTGETVIGNIGFEQKMDYTVIGDAVNTVFRIQDVCRSMPNSILASEMTLRAAQSQPQVHPLMGCTADDPAENIAIYEIVGKGD